MPNHRGSILLAALLAFAYGCGPGSGVSASPAPSAPVIMAQPASQAIAVGQTATFTVTATGQPPLAYQWSWNGMALNAHGATFTTPPAVPSDDQSTLSVTVTNAVGAVTSEVATLSVPGSPRRPVLGDLRFKDVGSFPFPLTGIEFTGLVGGMKVSYLNQVGTPLTIGSGGPVGWPGGPINCFWSYSRFLLPEGAVGRSTTYQSGTASDFPSTLASLQGSDAVITSLDLLEGQGAYAFQAVKAASPEAYPLVSETLPPTDLQVAATQHGAEGRVITAISLSGGKATYIAHGRQGDTTARYESSVRAASVGTVSEAAANLAQQGYLITAVGGNCAEGFLLVGTRVQGDTAPRPFRATDRMIADRGFVMVGAIFIYDAASSGGVYLYFYEQ
ncbi:MAG: hypothetical protein U0P46_09465 [Holophagaceae bacterium]